MEKIFLKVFVLLGVVFGLQIINTDAQLSRLAKQIKPNVPVAEDHRCFTLTRRTVLVEDIVTYVCSRPYPGVVIIGYYNSPIGPICKGRVRIPSTRYFRAQMCCPGWSPDQYGRCTLSNKPQVPEIPAKNKGETDNKRISIPFNPVAILMKRMQEFARQKQTMMHMRMAQMNNQTVSPAPAMLRNIQRMKVAAIRHRMQQMAQQRQQMAQQRQQIAQQQIAQQRKQMAQQQIAQQRQQMAQQQIAKQWQQMAQQQMAKQRQQVAKQRQQMAQQQMAQQRQQMAQQQIAQQRQQMAQQQMAQQRQQMVQQQITQQRQQMAQQWQLMAQQQQQQMEVVPPRQMSHVPMQFLQTPSMPLNPSPITRPVQISIPHPIMNAATMRTPEMAHQRMMMMMMQRPPMMPSIMNARLMHMMPTVMERLSLPGSRVSKNEEKKGGPEVLPVAGLPREPFKDPRVTIQPGPNAQLSGHNCFANYAAKMKRCFSNADLPAPPAVGPIGQPNDLMLLNAVCSKRKMIAVCLFTDVSPCQSAQENVVVRRMLSNVAGSLENMCWGGVVEDVAIISPTEPDVEPLSTTTVLAPVENISHVKANEAADHSGQTSLHHDIKIDEMEVQDYYWPLLIGTVAGFIVMVILLTATVCVCCRRRYCSTFSLKKEDKTPILFDGIYSIGLPPPVYEVTGIPPLCYEEIRGEKFTGSDTESKSTNVGQISDI